MTEIVEQFSPDKYKHLSIETPMEIWIAEFLSRNSDFMDLYEKATSYEVGWRKLSNEILHKFRVLIIPGEGEPLSLGTTFTVVLAPPLSSLRITNDSKKVNAFKKKNLNYNDPKAGYYACVRPEDIASGVDLFEKLGTPHLKDALILVINLNRNRQRTVTALDELIDIHFQETWSGGSLKSENMSLWRFYLEVYDFRETDKLKYREISERITDRLYESHEEIPEGLYDTNTLKRYYERAKNLINGDYIKYI